MSYKLEYLPSARKDMIEIIKYISKYLNNPSAADELTVELIEAGERLIDFPYSCPIYVPIKPLKHEYRKLLVKNYLMFYSVNETNKIVTIARVVYAKRDYEILLK